jgi:hypothetical protein
MVTLKPKEGGGSETPGSFSPVRTTPIWVPIGLAILLVAVSALAYTQSSAKSSFEERIAALENSFQIQLQDQAKRVQTLQDADASLSSDLDVVTKRVGVTNQELVSARKFAEQLQQEQEKAKIELANELATKASSKDVEGVAANFSANLLETTNRVSEVQKSADTKIGTVSNDVKTVAANLESTNRTLAESRRDLIDVKNTLTDQIARNATELQQLRLKGERDFVEFDIKKGKKNEMQRVGDIRVELRDTDTKKQKYNLIIQVDDNKLEKKDRLVNEPLQFLVGRDRLRYEIVVNLVDKDRIRGYLSTPKDKVLAAERPSLR